MNIYVIKSLYSNNKYVMKLLLTNKNWENIKKDILFYNPNIELIKEINNTCNYIKLRLLDKLSTFYVNNEWYQCTEETLNIINKFISTDKKIKITESEVISILKEKSRCNKKLKVVANYILLNKQTLTISNKDLDSDKFEIYNTILQIVSKLDIKTISNLKFNYKNCLNLINNKNNPE